MKSLIFLFLGIIPIAIACKSAKNFPASDNLNLFSNSFDRIELRYNTVFPENPPIERFGALSIYDFFPKSERKLSLCGRDSVYYSNWVFYSDTLRSTDYFGDTYYALAFYKDTTCLVVEINPEFIIFKPDELEYIGMEHVYHIRKTFIKDTSIFNKLDTVGIINGRVYTTSPSFFNETTKIYYSNDKSFVSKIICTIEQFDSEWAKKGKEYLRVVKSLTK